MSDKTQIHRKGKKQTKNTRTDTKTNNQKKTTTTKFDVIKYVTILWSNTVYNKQAISARVVFVVRIGSDHVLGLPSVETGLERQSPVLEATKKTNSPRSYQHVDSSPSYQRA